MLTRVHILHLGESYEKDPLLAPGSPYCSPLLCSRHFEWHTPFPVEPSKTCMGHMTKWKFKPLSLTSSALSRQTCFFFQLWVHPHSSHHPTQTMNQTNTTGLPSVQVNSPCETQFQMSSLEGWSNSTVGKVLVLHVAALGSILSILYGPLITAKNDS